MTCRTGPQGSFVAPSSARMLTRSELSPTASSVNSWSSIPIRLTFYRRPQLFRQTATVRV